MEFKKHLDKQKIEFLCANGVEFVKEFSPGTVIWNREYKTLDIHDLIDQLGLEFDGVIGWEATSEDIAVLREAEYIK